MHSWICSWDWAYYRYYLKTFTAALKQMSPPPDVVVMFNDLVSPEYVKRAVPGVKTVVWLQNAQETRRRNLPKALRAIDQYLTCSSYIKDFTIEKYGLNESHVAVVHSGVDLAAFYPTPDYLETGSTLRTLFIGRIDANKGPDIATDAVLALQKEGLNVSLTVAGAIWYYIRGNEHTDSFFPILKSKMEEANAIFTGYVPRTEVPGVVREHDVAFVLSRSKEPFGLVTLEAMASGCAVLASDRGGLPEACGGAAILLDPDDLNSVIASLRRLATDADYLREMKQRSIQRAAEASWDVVGERLNSILDSLL